MPNLTIEQLQLFLLAVMPGIIAIKFYDLFYPPEKRDFGSSLLEAAAYGLINFSIWSWLLLKINKKEWIEENPVGYGVLSFCFLVLSPAGLALAVVVVRNLPWVGSRLGYPTKTAWDDYFRRRQECWILFHLKTGKMVGGYFGARSYVSTFPQQPEVYVEEVWRVDDKGEFVEMVEGTIGMVIRATECERLEFLTVEEDEQNGSTGTT